MPGVDRFSPKAPSRASASRGADLRGPSRIVVERIVGATQAEVLVVVSNDEGMHNDGSR
ncbi:hypothetical protein BSIN_4247 [Burkholderia singularis]|uniref:Uncharacterized protein n=1 Tax=Burkholderia singularis TaxID=1503053 RepID=A0A238H808_9BURK|nr:hypothetical protein BSIN_4247 [Burkholderia singularis]